MSLTSSRGELLQIVSNIVANAIDAMPEGGRLRVRTIRRLQPDGVEIEFADNGVGIPKEQLDKVFEPFFTTKGNLGTGIGLWVVKQLVEKREGMVTISSQRDSGIRGTTISIFLPLHDPAKAESNTIN